MDRGFFYLNHSGLHFYEYIKMYTHDFFKIKNEIKEKEYL